MKRRTVVAYAATAAALILAGCSGGSGGSDDAETGESTDQAPAVATENEDEAGPAAQEEAEAADGRAEGDAGDDGASGSSDDASGGVISQIQAESVQRSIAHTTNLEITTDDIEEAASRAVVITISSGGYIGDEHTSDSVSTLTLQIPTDRYDAAVDDLQKIGTVTDRSRSAQDVTQEVVDTESRITSQRESIARIRSLLSEAQDIGDVISIESELAAREADLDALLSRQQQLANLTSLATINVTFQLPDEADEPDDDVTAGGFVGGLRDGWDAFTSVWAVAATVLGATLPFLALATLIGVPAWMWLRRRRPQLPQTPQPEQS